MAHTFRPTPIRRRPIDRGPRVTPPTDRVRTDGQKLIFPARTTDDPLAAAAALHSLVEKSGYQDIVLDFSNAEFISPRFALPLVALCRDYRQKKVDFELVMPRSAKMANLLVNSNWAHLILPEKFNDRSDDNKRHLSALQFFSPDEHFKAVDRCMNLIMQTAAGLRRDMLQALEWALNEVTDNVINHAESKVGGILQVITFPQRERVEFYVVDAGITIPVSLRSGRPDAYNDEEALRLAIAEGVTRNKETNQGNGLFGTFRSCEVSGGEFAILSGNSSLDFTAGKLSVTHNPIPFKGTFVKAAINYSYSGLLEKAFIFAGKAHVPKSDYIERIYEGESDTTSFVVRSELQSFGSRDAGRIGRTKLSNLLGQVPGAVVCDFDGVNLISSSFADEVFGKLFVELGPLAFGQSLKFVNLNSTVKALIDRAILIRVRQEGT